MKHDGVSLGAANLAGNRIVDIHPSPGNRSNGSAGKYEHPFPGFIASLAVASRYRADRSSHPFRHSHQPHHNIQRMRAEITECSAAGNLRIRHPAPFGIEPSAKRAGMTV